MEPVAFKKTRKNSEPNNPYNRSLNIRFYLVVKVLTVVDLWPCFAAARLGSTVFVAGDEDLPFSALF